MKKRRGRRSIRLPDYDYSQRGCYFVTVCIQGGYCLLGDVIEGETHLNDAGRMVDKWWQKISDKYQGVEISSYVIMPNHVHGIIQIVDPPTWQTHGLAPAVGKIVQWFKTMTTNEYIRQVKEVHWPSFEKYLWQRNYYEHVIRNDTDMLRVGEYIMNNPIEWLNDEYHV